MGMSDVLKREMKKSNGSVRVVPVDKSQIPTVESMASLIKEISIDGAHTDGRATEADDGQ